jgi:hypothetical protein
VEQLPRHGLREHGDADDRQQHATNGPGDMPVRIEARMPSNNPCPPNPQLLHYSIIRLISRLINGSDRSYRREAVET